MNDELVQKAKNERVRPEGKNCLQNVPIYTCVYLILNMSFILAVLYSFIQKNKGLCAVRRHSTVVLLVLFNHIIAPLTIVNEPLACFCFFIHLLILVSLFVSIHFLHMSTFAIDWYYFFSSHTRVG